MLVGAPQNWGSVRPWCNTVVRPSDTGFVTTSQNPRPGDRNGPSAYPQHGNTGPQPHRYGYAPQQQYSYPPPQQHGAPQWAPPAGTGPQHPTGWGPAPAPVAAPRNGLGIAALCLGIVGILFGLVPFTGFLAFALGAVGVILGLVGLGRARKKLATNLKTAVSGTVLSLIAVALGIWGMVIVFTGLNQLAEDLENIPSASAPAVVAPADVTTPVGTATYQLEITGDAGGI